MNNEPLDLEAIATRLRSAIEQETGSGVEFALKTEVPYSTMRAYLHAQRPPSPEFMTAVYRVFGILPSWLLTGDLPIKLGGTKEDGSESGFVVIPVYSARAAAGTGSINGGDAEQAEGGLCFSRAWLAKRHLAAGSLSIINIHGNSMEPRLFHGDPALIDRGDTQPRSGFMYVIRHGDELLAKFCQVLPGGVLRVSSENPAYPPYDVDLSKTPDVQIVGRVVASMHEW